MLSEPDPRKKVERARKALEYFRGNGVSRRELAESVTRATNVPCNDANLEDLLRLVDRRSVRYKDRKLPEDIEGRCDELIRIHCKQILNDIGRDPEFNTEILGIVNTTTRLPVQVGDQDVKDRVGCAREDAFRELEMITWAPNKGTVAASVIAERAEAVLRSYMSRLKSGLDLQVKTFRAEQFRFGVANVHGVLDIERLNVHSIDRELLVRVCERIGIGWRDIEGAHMPEEQQAGVVSRLKMDVGYSRGRFGTLLSDQPLFNEGLDLLLRSLGECLSLSDVQYREVFSIHTAHNLLLLIDRYLATTQIRAEERRTLVHKMIEALERLPSAYLVRPICALADDTCPKVPHLLDAIKQTLPERWNGLATACASTPASKVGGPSVSLTVRVFK